MSIQSECAKVCAFNMTCYRENLTPYLEYTKCASLNVVQETPYLVNQQKYE